jgi:DNA adenine methylase
MAATRTDTSKKLLAKPFLKWAGGKRQLLKQFARFYPPGLGTGDYSIYHEPFLGSGAVFVELAQHFPLKNFHLSDVNHALVITYRVLQSRVADLTDGLLRMEKQWLAAGKAMRLKRYYEVRVNGAGQFNTPAGDYEKPVICDAGNLSLVAQLLTKATIRQQPFGEALQRVKAGSFVYLDPPYRPLGKTASFTAYSAGSFDDREQESLAKVFRRLSGKGVKVMLSNSDTGDGYFDQLYSGFHIARVPARRAINSMGNRRGPVDEIIVTNYPAV